MTAFSADSIESTTVVGYQTSNIAPDYSIGINTFCPIAGTMVELNNLKISGKGLSAGLVQIQTISSDTATDRTFMWIPQEEATDYEMTKAGWFDADNWAPVSSDTFKIGEGFLFSNDFGDGATVTYNGIVPSAATVVAIPANYSVSGNSTPVTLDIQSIVIEGKGLSAGLVQIQTISSDTATDRTFMWIPQEEAIDYEMTKAGWFDADNWAPVKNGSVLFEPGEGFLVSNDVGEGAFLKLPSPLE